MSKVVIVGFGHVGGGMQSIFQHSAVHDPAKGFYAEGRGKFDLAIVCVPTPQREDGSCDTSIVEKAVREVPSDLVLIKSTVTPGTTARLHLETDKRVAFSPEYMGESGYWTPPRFPDPLNPVTHGFMIIGGTPDTCADVADIFLPELGPATRFRFMSATEAEIVKYAENAFFALKVAFANDLRLVCEAANVNYHAVREGWIDDPRVGPMHTAAFKGNRGFGGKCLPKDASAFLSFCKSLGLDGVLMQAVIDRNTEHRKEQP